MSDEEFVDDLSGQLAVQKTENTRSVELTIDEFERLLEMAVLYVCEGG